MHYVQSHYAANSYVVFDGYPEADMTTTKTASTSTASTTSSMGTKKAERSRRKTSASIPTFDFQRHTKIPCTPEKFLSNEQNKKKLIQTLTEKFQSERFLCKQAEEDADALIINTAIEIAEDPTKIIVIVGQDIDLLVLLNQLNSNNFNIYFHKPGSGNTKDTFYTSNSFKHE